MTQRLPVYLFTCLSWFNFRHQLSTGSPIKAILEAKCPCWATPMPRMRDFPLYWSARFRATSVRVPRARVHCLNNMRHLSSVCSTSCLCLCQLFQYASLHRCRITIRLFCEFGIVSPSWLDNGLFSILHETVARVVVLLTRYQANLAACSTRSHVVCERRAACHMSTNWFLVGFCVQIQK